MCYQWWIRVTLIYVLCVILWLNSLTPILCFVCMIVNLVLCRFNSPYVIILVILYYIQNYYLSLVGKYPNLLSNLISILVVRSSTICRARLMHQRDAAYPIETLQWYVNGTLITLVCINFGVSDLKIDPYVIYCADSKSVFR